MIRVGAGAEFVRALALLLLLSARPAGAEAPPASIAPCRDLPHTALSQLPDGIAGCARLALDAGFAQMPAGQWTWRDAQAPAFVQGALAFAGRAEIGLALPVVFHVEAEPSDAAHAFLANRVTAGSLHLDGKFVLVRRPAEAHGFGLAARVWNDLPLPPAADARVGTGIATVADWRFAHGVLVAAHAGLTFGIGYHVDRPAAESIVYGLGLHVPLGHRAALLAELDGLAALPGSTGTKLDAWLGVRIRDDRVFLTLAAGAPLLDRDAILVHLALHWDGGARRPQAVTDETEPPPDGCFETRCTPVQRAAVARVYTAQIDTLRAGLIRFADLIELRIRERTGARREHEIVRLPIENDLSIRNDAARKRELSIRFLVAAFLRTGIPIDRETAAALIDRTGWRVQVERDIDEPRVDYFTYDLPKLGAEYAALLRDRAARLREAMAALRAGWVETDEIFFDIARGHANGVIGVVNGLLDLPLAPINLARFATGRETLHGLGRIPRLEYRSDWGRKFGGSMELGVALGTMTGPGTSIFTGLGRTVAPAVGRLSELSRLGWNGLPVGKFVQTILVKWMQGSVFAVKAHAAADAAEILRALVTGQVRNPDGTYRPMNADDFEQLVFAFIQDAAVAKEIVEGKRAIEEEPLRERQRQRGESARTGKQPPKPRLPKDGVWSGEEGNSFFKPNNPARLGLRPDEVIEFVDGRPDFSPWAVDEFEVQGMNGKQDHDRNLIKRELARRKGMLNRDGTPNASAAERWLDAKDLALHHAGGLRIQLIPWDLHDLVKHTGGAYDLRRRRNPGEQ